jgi:hypothetical protein
VYVKGVDPAQGARRRYALSILGLITNRQRFIDPLGQRPGGGERPITLPGPFPGRRAATALDIATEGIYVINCQRQKFFFLEK